METADRFHPKILVRVEVMPTMNLFGRIIGPRPQADEDRSIPYGIDKRPMPDGDDPDGLLPREVGLYVREPIRALETKGGPIYSNYRRGTSCIFVELGISDDASGARMALATAKSEIDAEFPDIPQISGKQRDVSFLKTANRLGAFMAWTRGRYYFSAHAKEGEKELDELMRLFPY